jgi:hypothetical protein
MMTHETTASPRLNASLIDVLFLVALGTVVHLHAIPRISFPAGDISAPNVAAVTGDSVFLIDLQGFGLADMAVAGYTVHARFLNMRRV